MWRCWAGMAEYSSNSDQGFSPTAENEPITDIKQSDDWNLTHSFFAAGELAKCQSSGIRLSALGKPHVRNSIGSKYSKF